LLFVSPAGRKSICQATDIPMTMQGAARHNVANALAAAAFCSCLGLPLDEIRSGLLTMSQDKNPGRCNVYEIDGYTVLVDFAHNPDALAALLDMSNRMPFRRKALCFGQAGDRPDGLIRKLARQAWQSGLDQAFVSELAKYHRGRHEGDVYAIIRDELIANGAGPDQVEHRMEEIDSLQAAMAWAQPGDLIVMLALERSPELYDLLRSRTGASG
jgi:cyanophycin synthetase